MDCSSAEFPWNAGGNGAVSVNPGRRPNAGVAV
jgi:hypothetical protein